MPYGQIKKYFRNTDAVINPGRFEIVRQGSEAWKVFKEILQLKVNDGNATEQNIKDLNYKIEQDSKI